MIEVKRLTKKYGERVVYDGFDLCAETGKTLCVMGPSGSGKTTLLNVLAGLENYEGEVTGQGKCSYVFQEPRLIPGLTVEQNIRYAAGEGTDMAKWLSEVELSNEAKAYPRALSGGMAQRVSIARAFAVKADTVLFDEPFRALDVGLKERMIGLFARLRRQSGATVVYVTHDPDEALACGDRVIVLSRGKIVFDRVNEPTYTLTSRNPETERALLDVLVSL